MSVAARTAQALWCAVLVCCGRGTFAAEPVKPAPPPVSAADEEFLEFLGADDVEDADWWDFFGGTGQSPKQATPPNSRGADEDDEHE